METRCWSDLVLWKAFPGTGAHVRLLGFQFLLLYWRVGNPDSRTQNWVWILSLSLISVINLAKIFSFIKSQFLHQLNIYTETVHRVTRSPPVAPFHVPELCSAAQSCPTLCDPMGCSPPGSSVHGDSEYWSG